VSETFRIERIVLVTDTSRHAYAFDPGANLVVGPVGSGKSSLLELIRYALGGGGILSRAVQQAVRRLILTIQIGERRFTFARNIREATVDWLDTDGKLLERLSVESPTPYRQMSAFLLEALGLPAMRILRSRSRPTADTTALSFYDFYPYCYISQSEVDRAVVHHLDAIRDPKRRVAFEVLMGLTDEEIHRVEVQIGRLRDDLRAARNREHAVREFLGRSDVQSEDELLEEQSLLAETAMRGRNRLDELRHTARAHTMAEAPLRRRLEGVLGGQRAVAEQESIVRAELDEKRRLVAQAQLDLQRLTRTERAGDVLAGIDFSRCPRCLQAVDPERTSVDNCYLCEQPLARMRDAVPYTESDGASAQDLASAERRRLEALTAEIAALLKDAESELDIVLGQKRMLDLVALRVQVEIDDRSNQYVSPLFEAIADTSSLVATSAARLDAIEKALEHWKHHRILAGQVAALQRDLEQAQTELIAARARLDSRRQRVVQLSKVFDDIIRFLEVPWYESARIDLRTYLPVVNQSAFEQLSGGEKTVVNVAYHLTLLTFALRERTILMPYLLIIDSPRKNLGQREEDESLAGRLYRRLRILVDTYGARSQLIVADNDSRYHEEWFSNVIELSYERPLIPDLHHPGPTVDTIST